MSINFFHRRYLIALKLNIVDFFSYIAFPAICIFLPWKTSFRIFRKIIKKTKLYHNESLSEYKKYKEYNPHASEEWLLERRLIKLIDHADCYLSMVRSDEWINYYIHQQGHWPDPNTPAIIFSFHWGAGMWALRHAKKSGLNVHFLYAVTDGVHFKNRPFFHWYFKKRINVAGAATGSPIIHVNISSQINEKKGRTDFQKILNALENHQQVMAIIDVPPDQVKRTASVDFLNKKAFMPISLIQLACDKKIPIYVYLAKINMNDGSRLIEIQKIDSSQGVESSHKNVFSLLNQVVVENSSAWHLWGEVDRFFRRPE